jgi:hypothetical protein
LTASGDFDGDGDYDCKDVDALVAEIAGSSLNVDFDINGDGVVDYGDLNQWLADAGAAQLASGSPYLPGDANLDGVVDGQDFVAWNTNKFTSFAAWCSGDFNADGVVDGQDFVIWNTNKFTAANVHAVPEARGSLLVCGMLFAGWLRLRETEFGLILRIG